MRFRILKCYAQKQFFQWIPPPIELVSLPNVLGSPSLLTISRNEWRTLGNLAFLNNQNFHFELTNRF